MRESTLNFSQNARRVYTATKKAVKQCGQFKHVECNDQTFNITARHGMSLFSFGENITIHVVAIGTQETEGRIESASPDFDYAPPKLHARMRMSLIPPAPA